MDRRLMVLNLRLAVALFLIAVTMLATAFIWAAVYIQY